MFRTLIDPQTLSSHLSDSWVLMDCRCQLGSDIYGREAYARSRIPGARFAHLENDLSGEIIRGKTGRHPLPTPEAFSRKLGNWGITAHTQVVAYDDAGGAYASRLWWMLNWLGHPKVAVLDGGWQAWNALALPLDSSPLSGEERMPGADACFSAVPYEDLLIQTEELISRQAEITLIDARGANRYAGQDETIDPVAGHIPGALSYPFMENLSPRGVFLSPEALRARFHALKDKKVVSSCGSGVTACHNILAMVHAGLPMPKLYPGSWSEWITDPTRPITTGSEP